MLFKIRTFATHKFGQTNVLPYAGEVKFDNEGIATIDVPGENELNYLLEGIPDLAAYLGEDTIEHTVDTIQVPVIDEPQTDTEPEVDNIEPQTEENNLGKSEDEKNDIGGLNEDETNQLAELLNGKDIKELRTFATESGFPEEEWSELTKKPLREYLKNKVSGN
jgi:hypothetical protein